MKPGGRRGCDFAFLASSWIRHLARERCRVPEEERSQVVRRYCKGAQVETPAPTMSRPEFAMAVASAPVLRSSV